MLQVIQTIKLKLTTILHRGHEEYSSDPYSNNLKNTHGKLVGRSNKTLGTNKSSTRCSSTLQKYINNSKKLRIAGISASFILFIISVLTIYPIVKNANKAEAAPGTASETYISINGDDLSANLNLLVKDTDGTFAASSNDEMAKFGVATNNFTGYTLSISGSDNDKQLVNTNDDKVIGTLDSIPASMTENTFDTTSNNGKWGYFPSKYNSEENLVYRPSPTTTASILDVTGQANDTANDYTIALGARANYDTPNGTYTNTFILTAVGNPVGYTITYDDNSGDAEVTNIPDPTTGTTDKTNITLTSAVPSRPKYSFVAWCLGMVSNDGTTCTGTEFKSGASYDIDQTTTNVATLFAVWKLNTFDITIKTSTGIASVSLAGNSCESSDGCTVNGLVKGEDYKLTATMEPGYTFSSWNAGDYGSIAAPTSSDTFYTVGSGDSTITSSAAPTTYTLTLDNTSATTKGSENARVTYKSANVYGGTTGTNKITNPTRKYTISGFTPGSGASGATISSTDSFTSAYDFNGWYTASSGGSQIINNAGALVADTDFTDSNKNWTSTEAPVLYAQWGDGQSITLPTIGKTGYTCSWNTKSDGTGVGYTSGGSFTPTASYPLYGVCTPNKYTITIKIANGITEVKLNGNSCKVTTGCEIADLEYGKSYSLVATLDSNYNFTKWTPGSYGTIANDEAISTTYTVGLGNSTITPSALGKPYTITFKTSNASSIVFNGTAYTNNQTATANYGSTYVITGNYASKYTFKSWSASSGTVDNSTYQTTTYVPYGAATITLTGQSVSTTIQSVTASTCTTTPTPAYDSRDNEVYWFAKLADGNCWMLDDLRLGSTSAITLTSSNTNSNGDYILPASGTTCFSSASCTGTSGATGTGYSVAAINTASKNKVNTNVRYTYGAGSGRYGVYYNFCAASAGTVCPSSSGSDATYDICPAGWRMPKQSEYNTLYSAYSRNTTSLKNAISLMPFNGKFYNGAVEAQGSYGRLWSSQHMYSAKMYSLDYDASSINTEGRDDRYNGYSIRCLLKPNTISGTMQNVGAANLYANGATGSLTDTRDQQVYTVAKYGNLIWMTRNIAIGCNGSGSTYGSDRVSRSLTSSNSNVSTTWSTSAAGDIATGNTYDMPLMRCDTTYGARYNYVAATAGTITGSSNSNEAQYSICPKGWRLFTNSERQYGSDFKNLFNPVTGGYYYGGSIINTYQGMWASSTAYNGETRGALGYYYGSLQDPGTRSRFDSGYIRCVHP